MATIRDADVLIWAASQIVEADDIGLRTSRFLHVTPYQLLAPIGRGTDQRQYPLLKNTMQRVQSTVVATRIRNGCEFVVPDWFYRVIIDGSLVLTSAPLASV